LFFVGANDVLLPGNAGTGGILSERDREKFKEKDISLSPGPKEKIPTKHKARISFILVRSTSPITTWSMLGGITPTFASSNPASRSSQYSEICRKDRSAYVRFKTEKKDGA